MPTYAYRCNSCQHEFEELQKFSEAPLVTCPVCHKDSLVRMIGGGAGLVFKGSGFYSTDYKKSSAGSSQDRKAPASHKKKDAAQEQKGDTKPDSKPESKSESKPSEQQDKKSGGDSSPSS
jgi:putative FmdB family regulatory protein